RTLVMRPKKNPKIDLESYRTLFLLIGFAAALGIALYLFNITSPQEQPPQDKAKMYKLREEASEVVIPVTRQDQKPPQVSKPEKQARKIEVIDNLSTLPEEFSMTTSETNEQEAITTGEYQVTDSAVVSVGQEQEAPEEPLPFVVVESPPVFPGCDASAPVKKRKDCFEQSVLRYVLENFEYSAAARKLNISGRVFVQFVIEKDGSVSQAQVVRGLDPILDEEALRVVNQMPTMKPAQQRGKPVRMSFVLPIRLVLR
ncbi:MAG: TonB family protein, partial [Schleiferiaceae bacterium]|nr:TonB family protein [Schleiferiaceae bacterium]